MFLYDDAESDYAFLTSFDFNHNRKQLVLAYHIAIVVHFRSVSYSGSDNCC